MTDPALRAFYERADLTCPPGSGRVEELARRAATVARPPLRPLRVLDLGCGDGSLGARLGAAVDAPVTLVALDWTEVGVRRAHARGLLAVRASLDGAALPVRSGSVDLVVLSEVIEHLVDPDLVLGEIHRVLVPAGTLLLSTPNLAAWFNRLLLLAGVQPVFSEVSRRGVFGRPGHEVVGHLRLATARALVELLGAHGFVDVELGGAPYHDVPAAARWLDRLLARRPSVAAILIARARTPG